ncbi:zonular occludens toxin domain-containing protein [Aliamphritea ceti]|uniref:zonular occludens toxin domain-containing protein n=1 Tax=Aliamphritea ceti TaxID=1524258 RepID=UPI0021C31028|nr:zonular occludens toxin domain-containing protein [Aliamphritea ceti]
MEFRFVTGKLGTGKTLVAVGHAAVCLKKGKMVATNVDLYPEHFSNKHNKSTRIYRLPDHPTPDDLEMRPLGNPTLVLGPDGSYRPGPKYDENQNSLLLLDELAQFLNTRNFASKDRTRMIQFLVLLRKKGWDAWFIVQHIDMVDKQIREGLAQETGYCRDMSRIPIPIIGQLFRRITGKALTFPKIHRVTFRDGYSTDGLVLEVRNYSASAVQMIYNTAQTLSPDYVPTWAHNHYENAGLHCLLTPWHLVGYKLPPRVPLRKRIEHAAVTGLFAICSVIVTLFPTTKPYFTKPSS